ncbi:hypothetical protein [Xanthomonas oryzae]
MQLDMMDVHIHCTPNSYQEIQMAVIQWFRSSGLWACLVAVVVFVLAAVIQSPMGIAAGWVCMTVAALYVMFATPDATGRSAA